MDDLLATIAGNAWWTRNAEWTRSWLEEFYRPLLSADFFLPALLAYDLRSAAERGERRRGGFAGRRLNQEGWNAFMLWAHAACVGTLSPGDAGRSARRAASARRLAESVSATLMHRVDVSGLRRQGRFDAGTLLEAEAARLSKRREGSGILERSWAYFEEIVSQRRWFDLACAADWLAYPGRVGDDLDPFLPVLLTSPTQQALWTEPAIHGSNPEADNPRMTLTPSGEFAKRDLGGIPSDLGRLAPAELQLLGECGRPKARGSGGAAYRTLFLYRAIQGQLLQRYSQSIRPAQMEPAVHVQIDLLDAPDLHRLLDPPQPPVISWYRAMVVEMIHQFARLSKPFRWEVSFQLNYSPGREAVQVLFEPDQLPALGSSRMQSLEILAAALPEAFASRRGVRSQRQDDQEEDIDVDFWLRVVVGTREHEAGDILGRRHVRAVHERGVRIERVRSGEYGLSTVGSGSEAHRLHLELDRRAATPLMVAGEVVTAVLDSIAEKGL